ncbi:MAG: MipA/OmpV family protein [Pseudomonadota bacterium]|nr:MipA/OmpV family protein [Pseudomonadota bacterium]
MAEQPGGNTETGAAGESPVRDYLRFDDPQSSDPLFRRDSSFGMPVLDTPLLKAGVQGGQRTSREGYTRSAVSLVGQESTEVGVYTLGTFGNYTLGSRLNSDLNPDSNGLSGELMAAYQANFTQRLNMSFGVGTTWANQGYMDHYYGVDPTRARATGLSEYQAVAGFQNAALQMSACYQLTDMWSMGAKVGYLRYLGDAANSPLLDTEEREGDVVTGVEFKYRLPGLVTASSTKQYQPNCGIR